MKLYPNNLKNREFDKEAPQSFCLERVTIALGQDTSEDKDSEVKPTRSKTDSSGYLGMRRFVIFLIPFLLLSLSVFGTIPPVITEVNPSVGPSSGGAVVTITGSGFTGISALNFGTTPAASFIFISDTSVTAVSPAHCPQVIAVTMTTPGGTSLSSEDSYYTFQGSLQAYVTNSGGDSGGGTTVSVFDTANPAAGSLPIAVGNEPNAIFITPDGSQAYVANYGDGLGNTVSVIDTASNTVVGGPIGVGEGPNSIAITPDGTQVYVANSSVNTVSVINRATSAVGTILVGNGPNAVAITPDGTKAFIANFNDNTASVIDTATNTVIGSPIPAGNGPLGIAITPDGSQAYVANFSGTDIFIIDTANDTTTISPQILGPSDVAITPDGKKAFVANYGHQVIIEDTVLVIDTSNPGGATTPITVGQGPTLAAITPDGTKVYVVNYNNGDPNLGTVSIIDVATNSVIGGPLTVGTGPNAIAITPDGSQVYIPNFGGDFIHGTTVSIIDTASNAVSSVTVGDAPTMVAIMPDQAPLAKFSVSIDQAGGSTSFDGSASVTPTGTIKLYSWNFGDGTTLDTPNSSATHIYQEAGDYTVRLTVTNSAGTSTAQIFSYYSFNNNNFGSYNVPLTNNGGPTATITHAISIGSAAPRDFHGKRVKNIFLDATEYVNVLSWDAPKSGTVLFYRIYRNAELTDFVAQISGTKPLEYKDHDRKKNKKYTYYITAATQNGVSEAASTTVGP